MTEEDIGWICGLVTEVMLPPQLDQPTVLRGGTFTGEL